MLSTSADQLLRILGKEPAAQGIIEAAAMPAAINAIEQAVARDEARQAQAENSDADVDPSNFQSEPVTLRQRAWPLLAMLKSAHAAGKDIVWGV